MGSITGSLYCSSTQREEVDLSVSFSVHLQRICLAVQACFQKVFFHLKEFLFGAPLLPMARKEKWDPRASFLKDKKINGKWAGLFSKRKKASFLKQKTSQEFLTDCMRATYFLGKTQSKAAPGEPGMAPQEGSPSVDTLNKEWCQFLKSEIDPKLKRPLSQVKANLLRYQLQDIANQKLFMLSDALFPKMYARYAEAECVATHSTELLEYHFLTRESDFILQCNKMFQIYKRQNNLELEPLGNDMLSIEIAINLKTFTADRILTRQPKGCMTGVVTQRGLTI